MVEESLAQSSSWHPHCPALVSRLLPPNPQTNNDLGEGDWGELQDSQDWRNYCCTFHCLIVGNGLIRWSTQKTTWTIDRLLFRLRNPGEKPIGPVAFKWPSVDRRYIPPFKGWGGGMVKNWNISLWGGHPPHTPRNISAKNFWFIMVSPGPGWIQGWTSSSEGCLTSSLSYLFSCKLAVTIYIHLPSCVATRVRTKKVQKGTGCAIPSLG